MRIAIFFFALLCSVACGQESATQYRQRTETERYASEAYAQKQKQIETKYGTLTSLLDVARSSAKPRKVPPQDMLNESADRLGECYIVAGKIRTLKDKSQKQESRQQPQLAIAIGDALIGLQIPIHAGERIDQSLRSAARNRRTVRLKVIRNPYVYLTPFGPGATEGSLDLTIVDAQVRRAGDKWGPWLAEYPMEK